MCNKVFEFMKKIITLALGLSLIACGGSGGSGSDAPVDPGAGNGSNNGTDNGGATNPFDIKLNADTRALSYSAFKVNNGDWNQITTEAISVSVSIADDIEYVAICANDKTIVKRLKVRGTINIDNSWCLSQSESHMVDFETSDTMKLVGVSTNLDISKSKSVVDNTATLAFNTNPSTANTSLVVVGKELDGNTFYFHQRPSVVLSAGSVHTIDFSDAYSTRVIALSALETNFTTEFNQNLHLPTNQILNLTTLAWSANKPTSAKIDLRKFDEGSYFTDNWNFGSSSSYTVKNITQFTEVALPLASMPEELNLTDAVISQDGLTVTFEDKPFIDSSLLINEYSIKLAGHEVTYLIDPLVIPSAKSFEITEFSSLPGIDSALVPSEIVTSVLGLSATYTSPTYPATGSSKLVVGSK